MAGVTGRFLAVKDRLTAAGIASLEIPQKLLELSLLLVNVRIETRVDIGRGLPDPVRAFCQSLLNGINAQPRRRRRLSKSLHQFSSHFFVTRSLERRQQAIGFERPNRFKGPGQFAKLLGAKQRAGQHVHCRRAQTHLCVAAQPFPQERKQLHWHSAQSSRNGGGRLYSQTRFIGLVLSHLLKRLDQLCGAFFAEGYCADRRDRLLTKIGIILREPMRRAEVQSSGISLTPDRAIARRTIPRRWGESDD